MPERDIIKIAVTPAAKSAIEAVCRRYGMSQVEMASRLYTWFAQQDEVLQTAVLDILPRAVRPDVAELMLQRLAGESEQGSGGVIRSSSSPSPVTPGTPGSAPTTRPAKAARTTRRSIHTTTKLPDTNPSKSDKPTRRRGRKSE